MRHLGIFIYPITHMGKVPGTLLYMTGQILSLSGSVFLEKKKKPGESETSGLVILHMVAYKY